MICFHGADHAVRPESNAMSQPETLEESGFRIFGANPGAGVARASFGPTPEAPTEEPKIEPQPAPARPPIRKPKLDPFDPDWPEGRPEPQPKA